MKRTMITSIGEFENITSEVGSIEEAKTEHETIKETFTAGGFWNIVNAAWRDTDFNKKLDGYLKSNQMSADDYESCSIAQRMLLQVIKRAFKRINKEE